VFGREILVLLLPSRKKKIGVVANLIPQKFSLGGQ
jgi:hypothetical protein